MERKPKPPFRVDVVDQFQSRDEYGYDPVGTYDTLEEAIAQFDSFDDWYGMGDAGLVYDSTHKLVWDGIREAAKEEQVDQKLE